ncbi:flagellar biosynthetic protein FliO [Parachitinimonas caeni]|uniref:Flagellar biosynthetic protein FliO n=1 Tax=Parachitinimonas caeni TaxID=3031301 RepID=A0ABT7DYJ3_9NEIS|nr:flagellar biosynthetic protein FliO [Parachitinimonas caeni]MDK2125133.1 flagellar biosynthetic protein FliO [Parachitinimonas caeni]
MRRIWSLSLAMWLMGTALAASDGAPSVAHALGGMTRPAPAAPFKNEPGAGELLLRAVGGLVFAGLAAFGAALVIRKVAPNLSFGNRNKRQIRIVESVRLSAKSQLILVQLADEELLLSEGEQGVQVLRSRAIDQPRQEEGAKPHV